MPRDLLIVSQRPLTWQHFLDAGAAVAPSLGMRTVSDGAVLQLLASDGPAAGSAVLTMATPTEVTHLDDLARLVPAASRLSTPCWFVELWAPWGEHGDAGVEIAMRLATAEGAVCVVEDGS